MKTIEELKERLARDPMGVFYKYLFNEGFTETQINDLLSVGKAWQHGGYIYSSNFRPVQWNNNEP